MLHLVRATLPRTLRAAKLILRWRGSKHARHSRHEIVELHPFQMTDHFWAMCKCGGFEKVSGQELAQAGALR